MATLTADQQAVLGDFFETMGVAKPDFNDPAATTQAINAGFTKVGEIIKATGSESNIDFSQGFTAESGQALLKQVQGFSSDLRKLNIAASTAPHNPFVAKPRLQYITETLQEEGIYNALPDSIKQDPEKIFTLLSVENTQAVLGAAQTAVTAPTPEAGAVTTPPPQQDAAAQQPAAADANPATQPPTNPLQNPTTTPAATMPPTQQTTQPPAPTTATPAPDQKTPPADDPQIAINAGATKIVEEALQQIAAKMQESPIQAAMAGIKPLKTAPDGVFDNDTRAALAPALSGIKMQLGMSSTTGEYSPEIGQEILQKLQDPANKEILLSLSNKEGTEAEKLADAYGNTSVLISSLDTLHKNNVLYPDDAALNHAQSVDTGKKFGVFSNLINNLMTSSPQIMQFIDAIIGFFTGGKTLADLTGGLIKVPQDGNPYRNRHGEVEISAEKLEEMYKESIEKYGADALEKGLMGSIKALKIFGSETAYLLEREAGHAFDAAKRYDDVNKQAEVFGQMMHQSLNQIKADPNLGKIGPVQLNQSEQDQEAHYKAHDMQRAMPQASEKPEPKTEIQPNEKQETTAHAEEFTSAAQGPRAAAGELTVNFDTAHAGQPAITAQAKINIAEVTGQPLNPDDNKPDIALQQTQTLDHQSALTA